MNEKKVSSERVIQLTIQEVDWYQEALVELREVDAREEQTQSTS